MLKSVELFFEEAARQPAGVARLMTAVAAYVQSTHDKHPRLPVRWIWDDAMDVLAEAHPELQEAAE